VHTCPNAWVTSATQLILITHGNSFPHDKAAEWLELDHMLFALSNSYPLLAAIFGGSIALVPFWVEIRHITQIDTS